MKRSLFASLLVLFSIAAFAQHTKKDLVGKWEGADSENVKASVNFLDTNKVTVFITGHDFPPYTYTVDLPKNPAKIDIAMLTPDGGQAVLKGFLVFDDDNTIRWQIFPGGDRPEAFDPNSDAPIITLRRIK
ncbi:MAG: hypothetical protein JST19_21290 [Bacteroidetes bacterium]|nr:hypothetical protein [Bacteroidota bacterium]